MPGDDRHEQKRVVSPAEALKYSDLIIMGRSLMNGDIKKNLDRVITSLEI
jgi:orotidine-5'-phosphate decarboxylase